MAKPPAGSSLFFGALADSGRIKQRKNGSYRMVLKGIDVIDWFTDRPDRVAGEWSPKKLVKKWDGLFLDVEPNAQATFEVGSKRELVTFEMFKPKLSDSNQKLSFKIRGIGKKNKDLLTGLRNERLSDASLFIDEGTTGDSIVSMKVWNNSGLLLKMQSDSSDSVLGHPIEVSGYTNAELDEGVIFFTGGDDEADGVIDVPVTLKNGLGSPLVSFYLQQYSSPMVGRPWQCMGPNNSGNGPTAVYYSVDEGDTKSVEASCEFIL